MKTRFRIITAKALLALAPLMPVFAHGGFEHVRGTVAKVGNNVLTIQTAKGNVEVKIDNRTKLTRNSHVANVSDLKPGTRVIAEVPEYSREHVAQSVRIGASSKTPAAR